MNKKSTYLMVVFVGLFCLFSIELLYLGTQKAMTQQMLEKKIAFVEIAGLPDLAISTETTYIRHRTLSDIFSIYKDDGTLREYFPSTFAISHSHILNQAPKER